MASSQTHRLVNEDALRLRWQSLGPKIRSVLSTTFDALHHKQRLPTTTNDIGEPFWGTLEPGTDRAVGVMLTHTGNILQGEYNGGYLEGLGRKTVLCRSYQQCVAFEAAGDRTFGPGSEDADVYTGQFRRDQPHGLCLAEYSNGDEYLGNWSDGQYHGPGILRFHDGDRLVARFENGTAQGPGHRTLGDTRSVLEAYWEKGNAHGIAVLRDQHGNLREAGVYREGNMTGCGASLDEDGNMYEGFFLNGLRNGQGIMTLYTGARIEGVWKDDKLKKLQATTDTKNRSKRYRWIRSDRQMLRILHKLTEGDLSLSAAITPSPSARNSRAVTPFGSRRGSCQRRQPAISRFASK